MGVAVAQRELIVVIDDQKIISSLVHSIATLEEEQDRMVLEYEDEIDALSGIYFILQQSQQSEVVKFFLDEDTGLGVNQAFNLFRSIISSIERICPGQPIEIVGMSSYSLEHCKKLERVFKEYVSKYHTRFHQKSPRETLIRI